jgi:hypothetical protein
MGFAPQAGEIDAEAIIVAFDGEGVGLALQMTVLGEDQAIGVPEVGAESDVVGMRNPRGQIVNRSTLLKEVNTDTAGLIEQVADMDDLVLQFDGTDAGKRFIEAWKRARIIVDSGGGHSGTPPTPPATPHP